MQILCKNYACTTIVMSTMGLSHFQWRHVASQTPPPLLIAKRLPGRDYDYAKHQEGVVANESKESLFFVLHLGESRRH